MTTQGLSLRLARPARPNLADMAAFLCLVALAFAFGSVGRHAGVPLAAPEATVIHLSPLYLPEYAGRTVLRMMAALAASVVFTFTYAVLAAKSRLAGRVLIPLLDVLQATPILGFLTFTYVFFMGIFPGSMLGAELTAIFVIFTSQAWNMAFAMVQSLRTVPPDLTEAARGLGLTAWQRFWRLEVPSAIPALIWNAMVSLSGGWFMLVAAETITVGKTHVALPGIGSYVGMAIAQRNAWAILYAIVAMAVVILIYDQVLFRPLVAWSGRFRLGSEALSTPDPWLLVVWRRTRLLRQLGDRVTDMLGAIGGMRLGTAPRWTRGEVLSTPVRRTLWGGGMVLLCSVAAYEIWALVHDRIGPHEIAAVGWLGGLTMARVFLVVLLSCLIWVPVGVWFGLRPRWARRAQLAAQFMAAFPANLFFPLFVLVIVRFHLDADVWLTPLMMLGTQWYILFNVVGGTSNFPAELLEAARNLNLGGVTWWRQVMLPGLAPYIATGAVTAAGGAWNASILAEMASWGSTTLHARGLGNYIAEATVSGDLSRVTLGVAVMAAFVVVLNRVVWRPLQDHAERRIFGPVGRS